MQAPSPIRPSLSFILSLLLVVNSAPISPAAEPVQTIGCSKGFDVALLPVPAPLMRSLKTVANPVFPAGPTGAIHREFAPYVRDQAAAIRLGKALFWDMQAGSDNATACATCHFQAGADVRIRGQVHAGTTKPTLGGNHVLAPADFPFATPNLEKTDDAAGSQGVVAATFNNVTPTTGNENITITGTARQTTGLNAPTVVNAVFNHRNFFNGRAQATFNGRSPFGARDTAAVLYRYNTALNQFTTVSRPNIGGLTGAQNASLASQAVGPALNPVEMSAANRTFPELGRKLLLLKPLGLQNVNAKDSVLGTLAVTKAPALGLNTTYEAMIQAAFQPQWWSAPAGAFKNLPAGNGTPTDFRLIEANFSLFWGLSIMMYEATLVSDNSPMDQFLAGRTFDPVTGALKSEGTSQKLAAVANRLLTDYGYAGGVNGILHGLQIFERPIPPLPVGQLQGRACNACHLGATTTSASVDAIVAGNGEADAAFLKARGFDLTMERRFMQIPSVQTDFTSMINGFNPTYATTSVEFDPDMQLLGNMFFSVKEQAYLGTPPIPGPREAQVAAYDAGWYNVGARPTGGTEDPGVGGTDPFGNPLSWVRLTQKVGNGNRPIPGGTLGCLAPTYSGAGVTTPPVFTDPVTGAVIFPNQVLNQQGFPMLSGKVKIGERDDVEGSFKTSSLRNIELTGPYFHNGGKATLRQVVEMYDDGGDFPQISSGQRTGVYPTDPRTPILKLYESLGTNPKTILSKTDLDDVVAFLVSLTDDRVRFETAPFDHPSLLLPNGDLTAGAGNTNATVTIPSVGLAGRTTPLKTFLGLNPFN